MTNTPFATPTRRCDLPTAADIDQGVRLAAKGGVGLAIAYMEERNIPVGTILRVLTAPEFHRVLVQNPFE